MAELRFRRGMTVLERQKYRERVLAREIERAYEIAGAHHTSVTCKLGLRATSGKDPSLAREFHARCHGEDPGNSGCLCPCHDDNRGGVESGTSAEIGDAAQVH